MKDALRLWYTADTVGRKGVDNKVIPPLRVVQRADFADKVNQRRFSQDIKPLVGTREKLLSAHRDTEAELSVDAEKLKRTVLGAVDDI